MEIKFTNVTVSKAKSDYKSLDNVSFTVKDNEITAIVANYDTDMPSLLSLTKRPDFGEIKFGDALVKKGNKINDKLVFNKKIGIVNYHARSMFTAKTVKEEIDLVLKKYDIKKNKKQIRDFVFKIVGLSTEIINRNPNNLSSTEKNKLNFALALTYNPEVLVFDNFELGLTYKERENFKRLLRTLKIKYHKTILLISDNVDFLKNIVDNYIIINNGNKKIITKSCYNNDIYEYTDMPLLVEYIKYIRSEGHNIDEYVDIKELIKGIYRDIA